MVEGDTLNILEHLNLHRPRQNRHYILLLVAGPGDAISRAWRRRAGGAKEQSPAVGLHNKLGDAEEQSPAFEMPNKARCAEEQSPALIV
jgi:hypothetical protein